MFDQMLWPGKWDPMEQGMVILMDGSVRQRQWAVNIVDTNSVVTKTGSLVSHLDSLTGNEKPLKVLNKNLTIRILFR